MKIITNDVGGVNCVAIQGKLGAETAQVAEKEFTPLLDGDGKSFIIDLSELEYISSAGLRVLLVVAKRLRQKSGKIVLCALQDNVKEVFEISGFSSIFNIVDTKNEAIACFE